MTKFVIEYPNFRNGDFEEIPDKKKEEILNDVELKCSRNVIGALFGDSEEFFYSFSKNLLCLTSKSLANFFKISALISYNPNGLRSSFRTSLGIFLIE